MLFFFSITVYGEYFALIKLLLQHVSVHLKSCVGRSVAVSDEGRTFCFRDFSSPFCSWVVSSRLSLILSPVEQTSKCGVMGDRDTQVQDCGHWDIPQNAGFWRLGHYSEGNWDTPPSVGCGGQGYSSKFRIVRIGTPLPGVVGIGRMLFHTSFPFV